MNITDIVTFNGAPAIDYHWSLVGVHECEKENYDLDAEDKILVGLLISMKHCSTSPSNNIKVRFGGYGSNATSRGSAFNKLRPTNTNAIYDRILIFADVVTPGKCFAILTESAYKSDLLMTYSKHDVSIGDTFAIIEPDGVFRALHGDLPLVNSTKPLYPVTNSNFGLSVPLMVPEAGKQRYFYLTNVVVELTKVEALKASCNGTLCDRQMPFTQTGGCGCLYFNRTGSIVLDMTVTFRTRDNNGYENQYIINHFKSWRTSLLFIEPMAMTEDNEVYFGHTREIRQKAKEIKDIVNANNGWNIVGWYRKGEIVDASAESNVAGSEITSDNHPVHISYLYPAQRSCLEHVQTYPPTNAADMLVVD